MPYSANPNLLTPFTQTLRRSAPIGSGVDLLSGRWAARNAAGEAIKPTAGGFAELVLEGNKKHAEDATFAATTNEPSETVDLPSAKAANQAALAYGIFRFEVDPVGFVEAVETATLDALLAVDAEGRLVLATSGDVPLAIVEIATADKLIARTLAQGAPLA